MHVAASVLVAAWMIFSASEPAPVPAENLSYFEGTWLDMADGCVLRVSRGVSDSVWVFSWGAGTLADLGHMRGCGAAKAWVGFDDASGAWVDYGLSADDASWHATSTGWKGDAMVWRGDTFDARGRHVMARRTFERRGPAAFSIRVEVSDDGATWRDLGRTAFVRGPRPGGAV